MDIALIREKRKNLQLLNNALFALREIDDAIFGVPVRKPLSFLEDLEKRESCILKMYEQIFLDKLLAANDNPPVPEI